ncbi:TraB/GumN family protein [Aestuariirhabdus sp. Z084]|uniref:TraB/GumN family protein n=1 Tax=Aestuariirhabdus haliotis TaxID=2918751 RepID=UPI00201B4033|nr:TraB/GumN family protein [Aestuariirhabdus haliotis]MCL6416480.1 TraB/GumN family protein [Aestuariirhabdus haliotis]MCL6420470.1 TraB/GumN family protein [Aestuariirhabdus haliotis]
MTSQFYKSLLCCALLLVSSGWPQGSLAESLIMADGEGAVWRISSGGQQLFIGGTLHMLGAEDYPLPEPFALAYQQADAVFFEADLALIESPAFQTKLMAVMLYPEGDSLENRLSPDVYRQLEAYCRSKGYPMDLLRTFRPGLVSVTLSVMEMQRLGMAGTGVDQYFFRKAQLDGKAIGELETVDEQLAAMSAMGEGIEDQMILNTLRDLKTLPNTLVLVKQAWRSGDLAILEQDVMAPMQNDYPDIYRELLVERNNAWMQEIERLLQNDQTELVLVGTLHLVGNDGILQQLRQQGYTVERW